MRIAKKIIFVVLALLPILPILVYCVGNVGADTGIEYISMGTLSFVDTSQGLTIVTTPDSLAAWMIDPIFNQTALTGVFEAVARMLLYFEANIGLPVCLPTFGAFLYVLYLAFIGLVDMLISLITFVPRKCGEFFGGNV